MEVYQTDNVELFAEHLERTEWIDPEYLRFSEIFLPIYMFESEKICEYYKEYIRKHPLNVLLSGKLYTALRYYFDSFSLYKLIIDGFTIGTSAKSMHPILFWKMRHKKSDIPKKIYEKLKYSMRREYDEYYPDDHICIGRYTKTLSPEDRLQFMEIMCDTSLSVPSVLIVSGDMDTYDCLVAKRLIPELIEDHYVYSCLFGDVETSMKIFAKLIGFPPNSTKEEIKEYMSLNWKNYHWGIKQNNLMDAYENSINCKELREFNHFLLKLRGVNDVESLFKPHVLNKQFMKMVRPNTEETEELLKNVCDNNQSLKCIDNLTFYTRFYFHCSRGLTHIMQKIGSCNNKAAKKNVKAITEYFNKQNSKTRQGIDMYCPLVKNVRNIVFEYCRF
jgi:hypothetical protein